uniref:HTH TFE/IIEalpha-type domain-containing protein n=1 Tax=Timema poppense TaxID=170557 RepID=A0A7R9CL47_TIMPO|nr:unnamed protein product [Timema poppensis]
MKEKRQGKVRELQPTMSEERLVTEVPSSLKQLARLVVRGFYTIEDALIVDMLVRNPCMKEDDICELLKFERKMLRSRIAILRNDKFIQIRLKMETGLDGKAQKVNYYFINYKTFVNVAKYKLDMMRKRLETVERDATSRASFKCPACQKAFTDLEADQLCDFTTGEFRCTYCREVVEEDQWKEFVLAPEILEPEPVDINTIRGLDKGRNGLPQRFTGDNWSGEATRTHGFAVEETRVDVSIRDQDIPEERSARKERPIWMTESTVLAQTGSMQDDAESAPVVEQPTDKATTKGHEDIMSVLLAHEKPSLGNMAAAVKAVQGDSGSDASADEDLREIDEIDNMDSDEEDLVPVVTVGDRTVQVSDVDDALIAQMTPSEKEVYIQVYQEYFSHMYD